MGDDNGKFPGIIPLGLQDIFKQAESFKEERTYELKVSFMEIYNEQINDLLNPNINEGQGKNLKIVRNDPQLGAIIESNGNQVTSKDEALAVMEKGNSGRQTAKKPKAEYPKAVDLIQCSRLVKYKN